VCVWGVVCGAAVCVVRRCARVQVCVQVCVCGVGAVCRCVRAWGVCVCGAVGVVCTVR